MILKRLGVGEFCSGKVSERLILIIKEVICLVAKEVQNLLACPQLVKVSPTLLGNFARRPQKLGNPPSMGKLARWPLKLKEEFSWPLLVKLAFSQLWKLAPLLLKICGGAWIWKFALLQLMFPHPQL